MGRPWCAALPVVSVPTRTEPKHVTLIYPFYSNHQFFAQQIDGWHAWPADLRQHVSAIIVDDGSPVPASLPTGLPFHMQLFRIEVDVRWNWLAARNIGFHHAPEGWCLVTDIDHVIPEQTLSSVVFGSHDSSVIYGFSRSEHDGRELAPHPNSWLLTRTMFWSVGGYDERLSGHYGTDGSWRRRCAETAPMAILADRLIRYEHVGDSSTTSYKRKQPQDARVRQLLASFPKGSRPKTLSFPYHQVAA